MSTSAGTASEPRYRYRETAPQVVSVPVAELLGRLPSHVLARDREDSAPAGKVSLPCDELFRGNTPRLSLTTLSELLPGRLRPPGTDGADTVIGLQAGWLALHYRLETVREEIVLPEPDVPSRTAEPGKPSDAADTPPGESVKGPALPVLMSAGSPESNGEVIPSSGITSEEEVRMIADLVSPVASPEPPVETVPVSAPETADETLFPAPAEPAHVRKSLFASLPILRRHRAETLPPATVVPVIPADPQEQFPAMDAPAVVVPVSVAAPVPADASVAADGYLAGQAALQAVFMTEEKLSLGDVVARAAGLPGLKACLLARGGNVLCTSDSTAGRELRTLSGQAMTLLSQIRSSSASMGLGSIPSVTLHAEAGALSILQERDLCLIVLHSGRGFLPGVRERLREILVHLPSALPLPDSSPQEGNNV